MFFFRSFISTRPTSKQLSGQRLTEFSLSAVFAPNGKIENQSLQLQWSEATPNQPLPYQSFGGGDNNLYDEIQLTDHPSAAFHQRSLSTFDSASSGWSRSTGYVTPDVFATSVSSLSSSATAATAATSPQQSTKSKICNRRCSSSGPASFSDQMVLYVSVDLRVAFFEWPGLIVRKQIVKEVRNDLTVLEVLQHLIKCAGIVLTPAMNGETARLFCQRSARNGKGRFEEIDYLQWRCALLAEMNSVQIQFVLDFTDTEDATSSRASSSSSSICPIDMEFKQ
uniref:Uncharacterized protein n=1 Tax=Panagrolaimus superbus TaxID=310955 RepID=A0A914YCY5_9BILA